MLGAYVCGLRGGGWACTGKSVVEKRISAFQSLLSEVRSLSCFPFFGGGAWENADVVLSMLPRFSSLRAIMPGVAELAALRTAFRPRRCHSASKNRYVGILDLGLILTISGGGVGLLVVAAAIFWTWA